MQASFPDRPWVVAAKPNRFELSVIANGLLARVSCHLEPDVDCGLTMPSKVTIQVKRVRPSLDIPLPRYMTEGSSGMDLCADVEGEVVIAPLERKLIPTGIAVCIPAGFEIQIRPRSGLALRSGVTLLNSPATIDSDYRGEISLVVVNLGRQPFRVTRGQRLAQLVVGPVSTVSWCEVEELPATARGKGGFGHTDVGD